jgi:hypothetical protein
MVRDVPRDELIRIETGGKEFPASRDETGKGRGPMWAAALSAIPSFLD